MAPVFSQFQPDGERYRSLNLYLKKLFGEKVYKVTLNGGMTCPNRDGHIGTGGCIFCSAMGSGDFAGNASLSITEQLREGKDAIRKKRPVRKFIAYFQAFTNTYAPVDHLEKIFTEAINDPDVCALSIATRPDCLPPAVLELLGRLNRIKPVWVELGLQTVNSETARFLFLPYETKEMMFHTIDHLNKLDIQGIKLLLLHILKGTDLAAVYEKTHFHVPDMEEYIELLGSCIAKLRPDIIVHRLTGDGPKELLIAPLWTSAKRTVLNRFHQYLKQQDIWQGKDYHV